MLTQEDLDGWWTFDDPAAAEAAFRAELADESRDPVERAELSTQLARALVLQERFTDAAAVLAGVEEAGVGKDGVEEGLGPVVTLRLLLERGRLLNSSDRAVEAVPLFARAARLGAAELAPPGEQVRSPEQRGIEFLTIDALHMLAIADPDGAPAWTADAVRLASQSTEDRTRRWLVSLHNNLGWHLLDTGRHSEAGVEFERAQHVAAAVGTPQQQVWAAEALEEWRTLGPTA